MQRFAQIDLHKLFKVKVVVLGSGTGTNCQNLLKLQRENKLGFAKIVAVFSDNPNAGILEIAKQFGIRSSYLGSYKQLSVNELKISSNSDQSWIDTILKEKPDLIVLAGFMRILSPHFIKSFNSQIINLHPSLLPSFRGLDAIRQAWDLGVKITGCTVHWVNDELDMGKIIDQVPVRINPSDTLESLTAKVHSAEHLLLPSVVTELARKFNE